MNQTENRSPINLANAVPVGLGALSLFGICLLLVATRLYSPRSTILPVSTATPFQYLFIGTEPGIVTVTEMPTDEFLTPFETDEFTTVDPNSTPEIVATSTRRTGFSITAVSGFSASDLTQIATGLSTDNPVVVLPGTKKPTNTPFPIQPSKSPTASFTPRVTSTPLSLPTVVKPTLVSSTNTAPPANNVTPSRTPTSASVAPLNAGTYDETDSRIQYFGSWSAQTNVSGAYQGTLHVSTTLGNSIKFSFIGQELRIFFEAAPSLGTISIVIDQKTYTLDQLSEDAIAPGSEWISEFYPAGGTHSVTIQHVDGGSVNLDQVVIPAIVPTPTSTPRP